MVVISHCTPQQLNAYATVPLSQSVISSVQQDFAIGSFARFGDPIVTLSIHDRPAFHNASHYTIRETLDLEGLLDPFLVIDDRTAASHAIWYVETTATGNFHTAAAIDGHDPPVTHEGENFTVWQVRTLTQDLPVQWACFYAGVCDLEDDIQPYDYPYDPHNPQRDPFTLGLDFSRKADARGFLTEAYITAAFDELVWSTDVALRRRFLPRPPVVVQLTPDAARESGLLVEWSWAEQIPRPGEESSMSAPYDWDSPIWSRNGTVGSRRGFRSLARASPVVIASSAGTCQSGRLLGAGFDGFRDLSVVSRVDAVLRGHGIDRSRTFRDVA